MFIETNKFPDIERMISRASGESMMRQCEIKEFRPMTLSSHWDGGSKSFYTMFNMETGEVLNIRENGAIGQPSSPELNNLPVNFCLVEKVIFCGKKMNPRIYMNPQNMPKYLEQNTVTLTDEEDRFFQEYRSLKSSYRPKNDRLKASLIEKGVLAKNGSVTLLGKNIPRKGIY